MYPGTEYQKDQHLPFPTSLPQDAGDNTEVTPHPPSLLSATPQRTCLSAPVLALVPFLGCFQVPLYPFKVPSWLPGHTLPTPVEPPVNRHLQVLFCRVALQPLLPQLRLVPGFTLSQVQNLAFVCVEFHAPDDCPKLLSIQILLQGLLSLERVNSTSWLPVWYQQQRCPPGIQLLPPDLSPKEQLWEMVAMQMSLQSPFSPAAQPALHPSHCVLAHPTVRQLTHRGARRNSISTQC